ncbi:MAG TPA: flagellar basal body rod protein FlgB [Mesorhizobium sp.]|jgi:flagellar basal-body rod protein FlgB|uniref:flagellar basal body rod protein FlgB n=1 Tax=Mesorhizobium sp. TaxID=1871066 RepID=UPI002DDD2325|nr:flagellar basal body rod protein FlgB [Mesorhizobium sp.]HEV2507065.1 flagellar basal body rod protein FlgB [Mesorhizobium sp.]
MEPVNLFNLATRQSQWLSVRQSSVAGNIANANTPGYTATDVEPFEKVLDRAAVRLSATQSGHLGGVTEAAFSVKQQEPTGPAMPSKNTVVMENELMKAGEIRRSFELNTAIVKAFHTMMMTTIKG